MTEGNTPAREYAKGIGDAVADRTINRLIPDGVGGERRETWAEVAKRVAIGNALLTPNQSAEEFAPLNHHLRQASVLMSGRHLQHGDATQPTRNQEVFTNCSTSASSFLLFYLLLNGSGVGRCYDNDMQVLDYENMPIVVPTIDYGHKDVATGEIKANPLRDAQHLYAGREQVVFRVPDSREGWAKAVEQIELMAFKKQRESVLFLEFSDVRERGAPIGGMQNRPASGPGPLMSAITNLAKLRDAGMDAWRAAMYADHYLAECVLVGGARRAARMATKTWRDKNVMDFIRVKRGGFLWSSNNSVTVDKEFWSGVRTVEDYLSCETLDGDEEIESYVQVLVSNGDITELQAHAWRVFEAVTYHSYHDQTGEPGLINVDMLASKDEGVETLFDGRYAESARYKLDEPSIAMTKAIVKAWLRCPTRYITNPCGEIVLISLGGYCVIADVVPYHAAYMTRMNADKFSPEAVKLLWDEDAEQAFRTATRALIRVNLMDSLYSKEVKRTNRIGVGMTGLHEYAFARFGFGWKDIVNEQVSLEFWKMLSRFARAVSHEAARYSAELGVVQPHTDRTMKPAGTTSKLFGLTEGAHLPSMRNFLRWVQFRNDDPLIADYERRGYPVRKLQSYNGTTIVGFPTTPEIVSLGMGDKLVTAAEATPEEQYEFLRLLEKWWIRGMEDDNVTPLPETGNQVSYTLKYKPEELNYSDFRRTLLEGQSSIRACSVMPQADTSAYEYQPEEPVTDERFQEILAGIDREQVKEEVGFEHVDCATGACPIDFRR